MSLAAHTTLGVGGPAEWFGRVSDDRALPELLSWAEETGRPVFVLGEGSNVVVSDAGIRGLAIQLATRGVDVCDRGDRIAVRARAGESWDALVHRAVDAGWSGIECLSGIPGTVGAAPVQNIGAYGQELSETLVSVEGYDPRSGRIEVLSREDCRLGYRTSRFKREVADRFVITAVNLSLVRGSPRPPRYPELANKVSELERAPTLREVRQAVLSVRRGKSMVLQLGDRNRRSAGSFFVNPLVRPEAVERVRAVARGRGLGDPPAFGQADGSVKLSAAWLVERAGFPRGWGEGPAGLSTRHCLALVNRGGARAEDLVRVAATVRRGVRSIFGVTLSPEPRFVGFSATADDVLEATDSLVPPA